MPLGGILARLTLPDDVIERFTAVLRDSIAYAWAQQATTCWCTIRRHAQEIGEDVIWPYVDLYVTDHTVDLGDDGAAALETLERTAAAAGALPEGTPPLRILGRNTPLLGAARACCGFRNLGLDGPQRAGRSARGGCPKNHRSSGSEQLGLGERLDLLRLALLGRHVQVGSRSQRWPPRARRPSRSPRTRSRRAAPAHRCAGRGQPPGPRPIARPACARSRWSRPRPPRRRPHPGSIVRRTTGRRCRCVCIARPPVVRAEPQSRPGGGANRQTAPV